MEGQKCFETCRLCAEEQEATVLIFSAEAEAMLLQNKLNKYLLIEVEEDDRLPKSICVRCCSKLQMVCDFIDTARRAQDILTQKAAEVELNEQILYNIKTENDWSDNESKINTMEVNVDPMMVLQNCEGAMSPHSNDVNNSNDSEDVTYMHAVDREDVTIKLIKKYPDTCDNEDNEDTNKPFSCVICNRSFLSEFALKNHTWIHDKEEGDNVKYTCNECGVRCVSKATLLTHLKKHTKRGQCMICGRVFRTQTNLDLHMANHTLVGKSFVCKVCGRSYNTHSCLKNHSIAHSNERPYKCHICKKGFKRNQDLKFHINQHTGAKPYKCPFCDKSFASSGNCYSHRTRMHPGWKLEGKVKRRGPVETPPNMIRTIVPKSNNNPNVLKSVMKYQCNVCSHTFLRRDNYVYHMYQHTGKKPFQCSFCTEEFVTRKGLFLHHAKEHPSKNRPLGLVSKNILLN
ncbi:zinc finger protein 32-like [Aricia agestis]|uniref:zinc finger protein 32-like n=1 Tax=Aricia agestis TaxID=91739 RepID=UPI001C20BD17|nr:zinc finger protein 32-like [Aricia agestis]